MRQGCISLGKVRCSGCKNIVPYAARYVIVTEEKGAEVESGGRRHFYCVDCSLKRGYAEYREEKGERILTFFPSEPATLSASGEAPSGEK